MQAGSTRRAGSDARLRLQVASSNVHTALGTPAVRSLAPVAAAAAPTSSDKLSAVAAPWGTSTHANASIKPYPASAASSRPAPTQRRGPERAKP
eukprot:CAMPEP_0179870576 /NCGR_PEP_ID=MMETSP0982-20121206/20315_1 /TAXON_ID=483367 /ORGANISM="non described non described, Strain CCMP 2436" /LENGTH=93 /DNA_ID=CAMNT_0021761087 /DNA_START=104 /DNA_END=382 /DNA_ORIENTATION=+